MKTEIAPQETLVPPLEQEISKGSVSEKEYRSAAKGEGVLDIGATMIHIALFVLLVLLLLVSSEAVRNTLLNDAFCRQATSRPTVK